MVLDIVPLLPSVVEAALLAVRITRLKSETCRIKINQKLLLKKQTFLNIVIKQSIYGHLEKFFHKQ